MQFFGITRLSIVTNKTLGSFRSTRGKSIEDAKSIIFDSKNLEKRMSLFKNFCLPTYNKIINKDPDFNGIFLVNHDMPDKFLSEIREMISNSKNCHIVLAQDNDSVADMAKNKIKQLADSDKIVTLRYDDDDALPINYTDIIRNAISSTEDNTVISINKGYMLSRIGENDFGVNIRRYPLNAFGLAYTSSLKDLKTVYELGPHTKITEPTIHIKDDIGFLSTVHDLNDSRIGEIRADIINPNEAISIIKEKFPQITLDSLYSMEFRRKPDV